ncbi:MAG: hypothetical protein ACOYIK_00850 [Coriobacteriales bacterium]
MKVKKIFAALFATMLILMVPCGSALALTQDSAGNGFISSDDSNEVESVEHDLVVSDSCAIDGAQVGSDIIGAGDEITISNSKVGGSIRIFSNTLAVNSTSVGSNITAFGNSIQVGEGTTVSGVYAFANDFTFYGSANHISVYASTVTIDGVVDGDVDVTASSVTVGPNAKITGTLTLSVSNAPDISTDAEIGNISTLENQSPMTEFISSMFPGLDYLGTFFLATMFVCIILFALLIQWIGGRGVERSCDIMRRRTGAMILSGVLVVVLTPLLAILLSVIGFTFPIAIVLLFMIGILSILAVPYTAVVTGRMVFKRLNPYASAAISGLIFAALIMVPYVNVVVYLCSAVIMAGCMFLGIQEHFRRDRNQMPPNGYSGYSGGGNYPGQGPQNPYGPNSGYGDPYSYNGYYNNPYGSNYGYGNYPYGPDSGNGSENNNQNQDGSGYGNW